MSRWYPRRRALSRKPENVQRRMTRRVMNTLAALVIAGGYWAWNHWLAPSAPAATAPRETAVASAPARAMPAAAAATGNGPANAGDVDALIAAQQGNVMVTLTAPVTRVLADDNEGDRHQRFLVKTPAGHKVLVAHNIDLAGRVDGLAKGDTVTVRGEFEWNDKKGGVIHWTHHDPAGRHQDGWIEFNGRKYQ